MKTAKLSKIDALELRDAVVDAITIFKFKPSPTHAPTLYSHMVAEYCIADAANAGKISMDSYIILGNYVNAWVVKETADERVDTKNYYNRFRNDLLEKVGLYLKAFVGPDIDTSARAGLFMKRLEAEIGKAVAPFRPKALFGPGF